MKVSDIDPYKFFTHVKKECHLFSGITDSTMTYNEGWHFAQMGRYIERADKVSRIIDVKYFYLLPHPNDVGSPIDAVEWAALLKSVSGLEMYRKIYKRINPHSVVDFLVLNTEFPRAIHFCVIQVERSLHEITGIPLGRYTNPAEQNLGKLRADLDSISVKDIVNQGLHEYLDRFQTKLNVVGDKIFETFFDLSQGPTNINKTHELHFDN